MSNPVRKALAPIESRVRLMIGRAIVSLVNDSAKAQELQLQLLDGEAQDGAERFQNYGFTAHPHPGAEALVTFPGGLRSHAVVVAVDDRRYRMTGLEQGEVAIYDDLGNHIVLGRDAIEISAVTKIAVTAPEAEVTANTVLIESNDINLGAEGGAKIARIGDDVDPATNKITTGSDKVKAA